MRRLLLQDEGERKKFRAIFSRFGKKANYHGYSDQTVLLLQVIDLETNTLITDHLWFGFTKGFEKVGLTPGVKIEFEARVKVYKKGYVNKKLNIDNSRVDFKLSHPTRIILISDRQ